MEQNVAKRYWHMIRVAMLMLRKGISKSKLVRDLNFLRKRGKIFHGQHSHQIEHEYEFSCSSTPAHPNFLNHKKRKMHMFPVEDGSMTPEVVIKALEMLPGFGRTPMVSQPFPLTENHVDQAAEDFINRFYMELRNQNIAILS